MAALQVSEVRELWEASSVMSSKMKEKLDDQTKELQEWKEEMYSYVEKMQEECFARKLASEARSEWCEILNILGNE